MLRHLVSCCLFLFCATLLSPPAPAAAPAAGAGPSLALTIYHSFALVRDRRVFNLSAGEQTLLFPGISAKIQPETALLAGTGLRVLEQDFEYDLLTPQALLENYVGRKVRLMNTNPATGERSYESAVLLSVTGGVVLRVGDRIETVRPDRVVFPALPPTLRQRPTLALRVVSAAAGDRQVQLSYLTGGLSWQADYVAELAADGTRLDLGAWVTLDNESGTDYRQAGIQLVAGEVHRVTAAGGGGRILMSRAVAAAAPASPVGREKVLGYHLYTLPRSVTLLRRERKQVALLDAAGVACRRELVLRGRGDYYRARVGEIGTRMKVAEVLELNNSAASGLGMPLPAGTVRVYSRDSKGALQFVGEDRVDHTPRGGVVRLDLGTSFDVTAEKKQVDFRKLSGTSPYNSVIESSYRITLHNGSGTAKTVLVLEEIPGDWTMLAESLPHAKKDSRTAAWSVRVPARGSAVLSYQVRVRF